MVDRTSSVAPVALAEPDRRAASKRARWSFSALALLLLGWGALAVHGLRGNSATIDEYGYVASAHHLIESFDPRYSEWHAPLVNYLLGVPLLGAPIEAAAPPPPGAPPAARYWFWNRAEAFEQANAARYPELVNRARLAGVALALALGLLVFFWARSLAPPHLREPAGFLAALLTLLHPELLAHGRLATLDVGVTFFVLLALCALQRYVAMPSARRAALLGCALGLAQAAKFTSMLVLLCALVVFAVLLALPSQRAAVGVRARLAHLGLALALALVVLHAVYGFAAPWADLSSIAFQSERLREIAAALPSGFGVPLPRAYVQAFDLQLLDQQGQYRCYLEGTTIQGGRLDYFAILFLRKTPEAGLLLLLVGVASFVRQGARRWRETALLLGPALLIVAVFSLSQKQIGLRMAMPAIPLVAIWLAAVAPLLAAGVRLARATWVLAALLATATLAAHPHHLSYFNLLSGGLDRGYLHALGSNYDWGQDLPALREWMEREGLEEVELFSYGRVDPATYGIRYHVPLPGPKPDSRYLVVSASFYGMSYPLNDHGRRIPVDLSLQRQAIFENPAYELHLRITPAWFVFRRKG